jgi:hypothetical protein
MDDIVKQAMAKWPNVPDCYGWLGLDARGNWYMRDEPCQRAGAFNSGLPGAKGAELKHEKLRAFIERNYACDVRGCWYFQNGPQRVFVELELTPWIWRINAGGEVRSHTGQSATVQTAMSDEDGRLYLATDIGIGLVHAQDMWDASELLEKNVWPLQHLGRANLDTCYGYVRSPQAASTVPAS